MDDTTLVRRRLLRWSAVLLGLLLVGAGGYLGFVAFAGDGSGGNVGAGTMGLAVATGFASFFSPCSFPLLLTFLTRQSERARPKAFAASLTVGLGAIAFFAMLGLLLALAGEGVTRMVGFDTITGRIL